MRTFYGYGNLKANYWFIGMEEGCGKSWDEHVIPRFKVWDARGRRSLEDAKEYHFALGIREFWEASIGRSVKVQRTWRALLKALLTARGEVVSRDSIADLQANAFAMAGSDTCLLELLPLPSPSIGTFDYDRLADAEYWYFQNRTAYRDYMLPDRVDAIRKMILANQPRHVVLYGTSYRNAWTSLVNNPAWTEKSESVSHCMMGKSAIWMVPHPCARGLRSSLFTELGEHMRTHWSG